MRVAAGAGGEVGDLAEATRGGQRGGEQDELVDKGSSTRPGPSGVAMSTVWLSAAQCRVAATCWLLDVPEIIAAQGHREPDGVGLGGLRARRQRPGARASLGSPRTPNHPVSSAPTPGGGTMGVGTEVAAGCVRTDIVHSHTSYANCGRAGRRCHIGVAPARRRTTWSAGRGSAARHRDYAIQRLPNLDVAG
jgi:hypothetical protein